MTTTFSSAWCLAEFDRLANRPDTDEITDADKYQRLAQAQMEVIGDIAGIFPDCLYQAPVALTASSDRKTFSFGTDSNGFAVAPYGQVGIYTSLNHVPDNPWEEGIDYLNEATLIRLPNNRTWGGDLYARFIPTPADISASQEPSLRPAPMRQLIPIKAVKNFAEEGDQEPTLAARMESRYAKEFARWMLQLRSQFRSGGALITTDPWNGATQTLGN